MPPATAVGLRVVPKRRALPRDAHAKRGADRTMEPHDLVGVQALRRTQRMDLRAPECLVDVDVPEPGNGALVEQGGLDRRASFLERRRKRPRAEAATKRLRAQLGVEVRVDLARLEEQPGAEPAHVPVKNLGFVVQGEHGAGVWRLLAAEAAGHAEMHDERSGRCPGAARDTSRAARRPRRARLRARRRRPRDRVGASAARRGSPHARGSVR
jgi:hypothetical protein